MVLLWLCSLLTVCIAWTQKDAERRKALQWFGLAVAFFAMGVDESIAIHERFTEPLHNALGIGGLFRFAWVIPYSFFALLFMAVYFRFFLALPGDIRKLVVYGVILYIGGSIVLEMIGGACMQSYGKKSLYYLLALLEEFCEMSGCIVFIYAFASYIDKYMPGFRIRITSS